MRNMNDDNTPGIFSPPFTVIATICAGGNTYVMSSFASDGRRLGRASAMVDQPSGESPSPCKNMIAHLLFGDIVFTSSPSVLALFFSEGASTELFAIRKNVGMVREDLNREKLFVANAAAMNAQSIMINRTAISRRRGRYLCWLGGAQRVILVPRR